MTYFPTVFLDNVYTHFTSSFIAVSRFDSFQLKSGSLFANKSWKSPKNFWFIIQVNVASLFIMKVCLFREELQQQ